MPRPLARLRRLWLDLHLWLGVGLLIVLMPIGLTGAALVWRGGLDHALYPERYAVSGATTALPPASYAAAAETAFAGRAALTQVRLPQAPGDPVVAVGRLAGPPGPGGRPRTLNAWIDPPSGRVLAVAEIAKGATMTMHRLHGTLLIPGLGRKVVGWLGWAMFLSAATGLWLWWPRAGFLKGLRWRRGASQLFNLHHTVGFWLCLPLAALSLTGVYISFPQTSRALFGVAEAAPRAQAPGRPDPRFAPPLAAPQTSAEAAVAAALAAAPGARVTTLNTPTAGDRPAWRIELAGGRQVRVDDATGKAKLGPARTAGEGGRDPLSAWMRKVHDGGDTPLLWRLVITLAGLAPTVLGLSGLVMWLRRRARRRALTAA
jgi:uncharacterized iron-regulated membrane protein